MKPLAIFGVALIVGHAPVTWSSPEAHPDIMKYTIYEDPITRRCAHLPLPSCFLDGDQLPAVVTDRWFESYDAATAALAELLDRDEGEPAATADALAPVEAAPPQPIDPSPRPVIWPHH